MSVPQQINFVRRLEEYDDTIMLFVAEKQKKTILKVFFRFFNCDIII